MNLGTIKKLEMITPDEGVIHIADDRQGVVSIPCDYLAVVKALSSAYNGFMADDKLNHDVINGKRIFYTEYNMRFVGFCPERYASNEIVDSYKRGI